jgi:hypothetical protein
MTEHSGGASGSDIGASDRWGWRRQVVCEGGGGVGQAAGRARGGGLQVKEEEVELRGADKGRVIRHTLGRSFYFILYN